jgi:acetolactate synthase-1/2/3 large subunit
MPTVPAGQAVVEVLRRLGVDTIFGVPGGQTLFIMDALFDAPDIRFVTTRHELAAACAADGYGRFTGRPGVALVTTGPGATNMLTGVGGAFRDSSPCVLLTVNNRTPHIGEDDTQAADHVAIFAPLTKWATLVTDPAAIPGTLEEAFQVAIDGNPGPVLVDFGREVVEEGEVDEAAVTAVRRQERSVPKPDPQSIRDVANLLLAARKPLVWAGKGVILAGAGEAVTDLAEALCAPVVTTFNGIGAVPADHPLALGALSRSATRLGQAALAETDLVLAIGNSLNGATTGHWSLKLPSLVQVDVDPAQLGRYYPIQSGIAGDARLAAAALAQRVRDGMGRDAAAQAARREWADSWGPRREQWRREAFCVDGADEAPIKPQTLVRELRNAFPRETVFCVDAGNPGIWTHLLDIYEPGTYQKPVGFGNMAYSLGAALAVKLAAPERPVAAVIGDGSLGMSLAEIETLVREQAPVAIVVMNNRSYGNIKQEQLYKFDKPRYIGVDFLDVDYAEVAKTLLADGERVSDPADLPDALGRALASEKPYLVDVLIDPEPNVWFKPF